MKSLQELFESVKSNTEYTLTHKATGKKVINTVTDKRGKVIGTRKGMKYVKATIFRHTSDHIISELERSIQALKYWISTPDDQTPQNLKQYKIDLLRVEKELKQAKKNNKDSDVYVQQWHKTPQANVDTSSDKTFIYVTTVVADEFK